MHREPRARRVNRGHSGGVVAAGVATDDVADDAGDVAAERVIVATDPERR
jgi:hypothetical protein